MWKSAKNCNTKLNIDITHKVYNMDYTFEFGLSELQKNCNIN